MTVNYRNLWHILIDKDMLKKDLREQASSTTNAIAKLGKNEKVSTEVLLRICEVLQCDINDTMHTMFELDEAIGAR